MNILPAAARRARRSQNAHFASGLDERRFWQPTLCLAFEEWRKKDFNEPVNTPEHALECFLRTQMDLLVLENVVVSR